MGQEYFNQIIPFQGNPNPIQLITTDKGFLVSSINFINDIGSSSVIQYNPATFESIQSNYEGFALTRNSVGKINNQYYSFGDYNIGSEMLFFVKYNSGFQISDFELFNTPSMNNGSTSSLFFQNHIYGASVDDFEDGDHREIAIKKIDTLGNEVWSKNFSQEDRLNYAWEMETSQDQKILISARVVYTDQFGGYPQIIKIDTSGNIIWKYDSNEGIINGGVPVWIAQLSDGNIIQSYNVQGNQSPDTRIKWIDKDGNYIKEQLIDVPIKDELYYRQIEAGRGEYFFGYGIYRFNDDDTVHGIITKFDNDGNIIWEHLYQHESFAEAKDQNSIKDIVELDNRDIVVLGDLSHPGENTEIWLFKINENGCFGTDSCDEKLVLTNVDDTYFDPTLKIYPNPGTDIIHIVSEDRRIMDARFSIFDLSGQQIEKYTLSQMQNEINVSGLTHQIYIYQIEDKKGEVIGTGKFVKK